MAVRWVARRVMGPARADSPTRYPRALGWN